MRLAFYLNYAVRSLLRDSQRTLLALLCIAFGVMSVVGMQLLAGSLRSSVPSEARQTLNADAMLYPNGADSISSAQIARLDQQKAAGVISAYTLEASNDADLLKPLGSPSVYLLTTSPTGVDPANFPLVGTVHLSQPAGASLAAVIGTPRDAVLSADLVSKLKLKIGDSFTLTGRENGVIEALRIGGIADQVPGSRGDDIYYSMATATLLNGGGQPANVVAVLWNDKTTALAQLQADGWYINSAEDVLAAQKEAIDLFTFMLKGAGILGLFVGGIGVANTLQVLLARRTLEIATLKTVGYKRRDLLLFFGIETALLGLIGSFFGLLGGMAISLGLLKLLGDVGVFLLTWQADPLTLLSGLAVGVLTALSFGLFTIVRASAVRPNVLLRDLPARSGPATWLAAGGLLLALLLAATTISMYIMGSVTDGALVIGGGIGGLIVLTIVFGGLLLLALSAPTPRLALLTMARRNLKSQFMRAIYALIALFVGIFAIGFAGTVIFNAQGRLAARFGPVEGYDLTVYGRRADMSAIEQQLVAQQAPDYYSTVRVPLTATMGTASTALPVTYLDGRVPERADWNIQIVSGALGGDSALLPAKLGAAPWSLQIGAPLTLTLASGASATVHVGGFYQPREFGADYRPTGVIVAQQLALQLASDDSPALYFAQVPAAQLDAVAAALSSALPRAAVVSQNDLAQASNRTFYSLFTFAVGTASLALVAGVVLIANGVGLAVVQRRREMGILKAVGFSAGRVLGTLLIENALLGLIAGVLGMGAVSIAVILLDQTQPEAQLTVDPLLALAMIGVSVVLALGTSALVAWRPTHVRPLEVLRTE